MVVAIPRYGEELAPCFEYSATIAIFTIRKRRVVEQKDFCLQSKVAFDRVRLLRDQGVDLLICGGVQEVFETLVQAQGIRVVSWVSGRVEEILEQHLRGELKPGSARLGGTPDSPTIREHH